MKRVFNFELFCFAMELLFALPLILICGVWLWASIVRDSWNDWRRTWA